MSHRAGGKKSIDYPDQGSIESSGWFSNPPKSNHEKQTNLWYPKKSRLKTLSVSAPAPAPETSALLCDVLGALCTIQTTSEKTPGQAKSQKAKTNTDNDVRWRLPLNLLCLLKPFEHVGCVGSSTPSMEYLWWLAPVWARGGLKYESLESEISLKDINW